MHAVVFCYLGWLAYRLARAGLRGTALAIGVLLLVQVSLGIGNVKLGLPLPVATAHNGVAALLLFALIAALVRTTNPPRANAALLIPSPACGRG